MKHSGLCLALAAALCGAASSASAANYSFTGNLSGDDDVQLFTFSVGSLSSVTLRTWSYAGGTNAAGTAIPSGGFDPILALFDSSGVLINQNDDGAGVAADLATGRRYDTLLTANLGIGTYTVSVMQYSNFAIGPNLSNGFDGSGTTGWVDVSGARRNSSWAFDILNVNSAVVQPPTGVPDTGSTLALLSLTLGAFVTLRRKLQVA